MAIEAGWQRGFPFLNLDVAQISELIAPYPGNARVLSATGLRGGARNSNYLVRLSSAAEPVVLRIFSAEEPSACCVREAALARLLEPRVPVPKVLYSEPEANPPWNIVTFVDGERMDEVLRDASPDRVETLSRSAGAVLAAVHAHTFAAPGWLNGPELSIGPPPWPDVSWFDMLMPWFNGGAAGMCLDPDLRARVIGVIERNAERMSASRSGSRLIHADYKGWNLLVRDSSIAAALDWEFAHAGNPMVDLGIYLRASDTYPPGYVSGFADGYTEGGGELPSDWFALARLQDLTNLGFFLQFRGQDTALVRDVTRLIASAVTLLAA